MDWMLILVWLVAGTGQLEHLVVETNNYVECRLTRVAYQQGLKAEIEEGKVQLSACVHKNTVARKVGI